MLSLPTTALAWSQSLLLPNLCSCFALRASGRSRAHAALTRAELPLTDVMPRGYLPVCRTVAINKLATPLLPSPQLRAVCRMILPARVARVPCLGVHVAQSCGSRSNYRSNNYLFGDSLATAGRSTALASSLRVHRGSPRGRITPSTTICANS